MWGHFLGVLQHGQQHTALSDHPCGCFSHITGSIPSKAGVTSWGEALGVGEAVSEEVHTVPRLFLLQCL